ncbi:MAG: hypothetical protein ACI4D0_02225 [Lachnospira sp.]
MKRKNSIILLSIMCTLLTACSANGEGTGTSATIKEKPTSITTETSAVSQTTASETNTNSTVAKTEAQTEVKENKTDAAQKTTSAVTKEAVDNTKNLTDEVSRLMGALDYIDCIGGGNIPKDETNTVKKGDRDYAKVKAQFQNTADLKEYIEENLSDKLIKSRYSHILGGDQPYYIDVNGALYGYVTAKGCGYTWIKENGNPVISVKDVKDSSFTAITKFDNYGGESEMKLSIVKTDGAWKIDSISYDGQTF